MYTIHFWLYAIHYRAKTIKVYDMRYRWQTWYCFVHMNLKRDSKTEKDEIKKMWNNENELKVTLWVAVVHLRLSFLKNGGQKCI